MANNSFHTSWIEMKRRCNGKKYRKEDNDRYFGRGITYDKKWESFSEFKKDMLKTYKIGLTLDRIDNSGNYCKNNCRWADRKTQANNTRRNRIIDFNGCRKTLSQWVDFFGLKLSTVKQRFYVYKLPLEKCFVKGRLYE